LGIRQGARPVCLGVVSRKLLASEIAGHLDHEHQLVLVGGGSASVSQGQGFSAQQSNANVALIGQQLATQNGLKVGSTFQLQGATIRVLGIYSSQTLFGDNGIYLPLATAQRLFQVPDQISLLTAQVDSADNVNGVATAIRSTLGTNTVDVTSSTDVFDRISGSLTSAQHSSRLALIAALVASVAVILFATALVTRQRVREIGILKAVGAAGWQVGLQFGVETLVVAVVAALVGALVTFPTAQTVANDLISSAEAAGPTFGGPVGGSGATRAGFRVGAAAGRALGAVHVAVTPTVFLYAAGLALGLALLASIVPAWRVSQVRPAEVLRYE